MELIIATSEAAEAIVTICPFVPPMTETVDGGIGTSYVFNTYQFGVSTSDFTLVTDDTGNYVNQVGWARRS